MFTFRYSPSKVAGKVSGADRNPEVNNRRSDDVSKDVKDVCPASSCVSFGGVDTSTYQVSCRIDPRSTDAVR